MEGLVMGDVGRMVRRAKRQGAIQLIVFNVNA